LKRYEDLHVDIESSDAADGMLTMQSHLSIPPS